GLVVERKRPLAIAKRLRVVGVGKQLVQHLVEDDVLDEERWHVGAVERRVNANLARRVLVHAEANRLAPPAQRSPRPADPGADAVLEEHAVELVEDDLQVEAAAARDELLAGASGASNVAVARVDEAVDDAPGGAVALGRVAGERLDDGVGSIE